MSTTRSYVDHWPHTAADLFVKFTLLPPTLGPITNSYVSHWPETGDGPANTGTGIDEINPKSYLDHFPKDGDLYLTVKGTGTVFA